MTNKKELKNEELEKVSGGTGAVYLNLDIAYEQNSISKAALSNYLDREVMVFKHNYLEFVVCGTLKEVYEEPSGCSHDTCLKIEAKKKYAPNYEYCSDIDSSLVKVVIESNITVHEVYEY